MNLTGKAILLCGLFCSIGLFTTSMAGCSEDKNIEMPKQKISIEQAYKNAFDHHPFGGRPLSWWRDKVRFLAKSDDPASAKVLKLMTERAENAGLIVTEKDGMKDVEISPATLRKIMALVDAP
jgi:hypothetical protein